MEDSEAYMSVLEYRKSTNYFIQEILSLNDLEEPIQNKISKDLIGILNYS